MAARIFRRLGGSHQEYLAEAHYGLGEILMENQNCSEAIRDYSQFHFGYIYIKLLIFCLIKRHNFTFKCL